jgi:hypothetical protein
MVATRDTPRPRTRRLFDCCAASSFLAASPERVTNSPRTTWPSRRVHRRKLPPLVSAVASALGHIKTRQSYPQFALPTGAVLLDNLVVDRRAAIGRLIPL